MSLWRQFIASVKKGKKEFGQQEVILIPYRISRERKKQLTKEIAQILYDYSCKLREESFVQAQRKNAKREGEKK